MPPGVIDSAVAMVAVILVALFVPLTVAVPPPVGDKVAGKSVVVDNIVVLLELLCCCDDGMLLIGVALVAEGIGLVAAVVLEGVHGKA